MKTVLAYNARGLELFRIGSSDVFNNTQLGNCSIDAIAEWQSQLLTFDASCQRVRLYNENRGAFIKELAIGTLKLAAVATNSQSVFAIAQDGALTTIQRLK